MYQEHLSKNYSTLKGGTFFYEFSKFNDKWALEEYSETLVEFQNKNNLNNPNPHFYTRFSIVHFKLVETRSPRDGRYTTHMLGATRARTLRLSIIHVGQACNIFSSRNSVTRVGV